MHSSTSAWSRQKKSISARQVNNKFSNHILNWRRQWIDDAIMFLNDQSFIKLEDYIMAK